MDLDVPKSILGSEVHVLRCCTLKFSRLMTRTTILTLQTMSFRREESRTLFFFGGGRQLSPKSDGSYNL